MLIGYGMPAVETATLTGGTWLSADQGAALFDGKPGRSSRIRRTGSLAITITLAEAVVPGIIAVLGLNIPPGVQVSAAGASAATVRLPDGSVCAWLFPQAGALVSTVSVEIATTATNVDVGEIAVFRAVEVGISDGWAVATIDTSLHTRTKGAQVNTVAGRLYRRLTCTLSGRATAAVRGGGLGGPIGRRWRQRSRGAGAPALCRSIGTWSARRSTRCWRRGRRSTATRHSCHRRRTSAGSTSRGTWNLRKSRRSWHDPRRYREVL